MNKLRKKTLWMLLAIMSLLVLTVVGFINISLYSHEYSSVDERVRKVGTTYLRFTDREPKLLRPGMEDQRNDERQPLFADSLAYAVTIDENLNIKDVTSYSEEGLSDDEIIALASAYLAKGDLKPANYGNLYFDRYAYLLTDNVLVILDNADINERLQAVLWTSLILLLSLEILAILISIQLTRWLVEPVREAFEKQRQFVGDASHELKTPLAVIMASAETLEHDPTQTKWAGVIHDEAEHMNTLVLNLLDLARSEQDEPQTLTKADLSSTVELAALAFESLIFEQKLKLKCDIQAGITLPCDPDKIKQLVSILLDNAIKHSFDKSTITVSLAAQKNEALLKVRNRGEAIPAAERERIFERFYRVDKARNRQEHRYGLGLAIAKNIAEMHNGKISVDCQHGYTTFTVALKIK